MLSRRLGAGCLGSREKAGPETQHPGARKEGEGTEDSDLKGEPHKGGPATPGSHPLQTHLPLCPTASSPTNIPRGPAWEGGSWLQGTSLERHTSRHVTDTHTEASHTGYVHTQAHARHTGTRSVTSNPADSPAAPKKWPGGVTGLALPVPPAGKGAPFSLGPVAPFSLCHPIQAAPACFSGLALSRPISSLSAPPSMSVLPLPTSTYPSAPSPGPALPLPQASLLPPFPRSLPPFISPFVPEET